MPTIEKLAENFVKAAGELMEAAGGLTMLDFAKYSGGAKAHMHEEQFNNLFGDEGVEIRVSEIDGYPIEKSIMVGGIKFFCLTKDWDTWAKLKGYVKEAV